MGVLTGGAESRFLYNACSLGDRGVLWCLFGFGALPVIVGQGGLQPNMRLAITRKERSLESC